nr:MAG TPA: hypothetical protein [Caudoviricetes sp.]
MEVLQSSDCIALSATPLLRVRSFLERRDF